MRDDGGRRAGLRLRSVTRENKLVLTVFRMRGKGSNMHDEAKNNVVVGCSVCRWLVLQIWIICAHLFSDFE